METANEVVDLTPFSEIFIMRSQIKTFRCSNHGLRTPIENFIHQKPNNFGQNRQPTAIKQFGALGHHSHYTYP